MKYFICCIVFVTVAAEQKVNKRQVGYGQSGGGGSSGGSGMGGYQSGASAGGGMQSYGSGGGSLGGGLGGGLGGISGGGGGGFSSGSSSFSQYSATNIIPAQSPYVFSALDQLRGNEALSASDVQSVMASSFPGTSYPTYAHIPQTTFSCSNVRQFGFYADPETRCQVFRRCEANNFMFSYICPNGTLFNQITLVCDWWYNVNCANAPAWVDYSNPRIYRQDLRLFDDPLGFNFGSGGSGSAGGLGFSGGSGAGNGLGFGGVTSGGLNNGVIGGGVGGSVGGASGNYGGSGSQYGGSSGGSFGGSIGGGSFGVSSGGSFGGSGAGGGGYSQGSSGPLYRSSASTVNQLLSEPIAAASEKSLREILAQLAGAKASPATTGHETESSTKRKR